MKKNLRKVLGLGVVFALAAQLFVPVSHAETKAVTMYSEAVKAKLNVSATFNSSTKNTWGTQVNSVYGPDGITYDAEKGALKFAPGSGLYLTWGMDKIDGYIDYGFMYDYDKSSGSLPSTTIAAMLPANKLQGGIIINYGGPTVTLGYTYGTWVEYRHMYKYNSSNNTFDMQTYQKIDGKYSPVGSMQNIPYKAYGEWATGGQVGCNSNSKNEVLYITKAQVTYLNSGYDSVFPQIVSTSGSGTELKLNVNIDLNAQSVTKENLDIPIGTVSDVSYSNKVITIKGTGLHAAFLTENILSADGMPAKTSGFATTTNDSTLFKMNISEDFTSKANYAYIASGDVTYVPANSQTGERAYLDMKDPANGYATKSIENEGYFDWGVKITADSYGAFAAKTRIDNLGIKLQGSAWMGDGFQGVQDQKKWMDFRMLVKKADDGNLMVKWLLKNEDGIYEALSSDWVNKNKAVISGWFTPQTGGLNAQMSKFEYTNAASDTWYPEIIGTEVLLDGKVLRVYTNRPLMPSTVHENSVVLATGSATAIGAKDNVITIVGEGLTAAEITGEVATADGLRKGVKTLKYTGGAVKHDCGTVTLEVPEALTAEEIASLENVKLIAGDSIIDAEAVYSAETSTVTLTFGELERLAYSGTPEKLQQAAYKVSIPGLMVDGKITVSDIPFEWLQVSSEYKSASKTLEGITYSAGAPEFVAATESSRAYLLGKSDSSTGASTLFYGLTASGHAISEPFYVDMAINGNDGKVELRVANATDISGASRGWPVILTVNGSVKDLYPEAYVAADGFADFRIALTQKANGGFERTVYNKNADGKYVVVEETATWMSSANTQIAGGLNYLTLGIADGGKVAEIELYKENPENLIPEVNGVFTETGATFTFSHNMTDIEASNVKVYDGENEISKEISYDASSKTLTVTAQDATKIVVDGVYASNGMPAKAITITRSLGTALVITDAEGNIPGNLSEVSSVKATAEIKNRKDSEENYTLYIARYNGENLISVVSDSKKVASGDWASFEKALTTENGFASGDKVKAFIWDSDMKPVGEAVTINYSSVDTIANNSVLSARVADEIADGDNLDIVYIGGSITQGTSASPNWVTLVGNVFEEAYPGKVTNYNAGVGGTTSVWGITRFDKDVLSKDPDVVFIEFAVNDVNISTTQAKEAMEGMVRQLNALENPPMVAFVYTTTYSDSNAAAIAAHQEIADYYNIPTINLRDYVWNTYWKGAAPTEGQIAEFWVDKVHPTALGYSVYADYIIANMSKDGFFKYPEVKNAPYIESYIKSTGKWLTTEELENTIEDFYGWEIGTGKNATLSRSGASGDASLIAFTFEGSMFTLKYDCYTDKGDIIVTIDDTITKTLNGYYDNGNGGHAPGTYGVYDLSEGTHTVVIEFAENSGRKNASITDIIVAK